MSLRPYPAAALQQELDRLKERRILLETRRDQELLNLLRKTQCLDVDVLVLTGALLDARKAIDDGSMQAEVWRRAGETFLRPERKTKAAILNGRPAQNQTTDQPL